MAEKTIQDFGEKIGGARKDLWAARGLSVDDLVLMNDVEKAAYATKNNVWPKPDWVELVTNGTPAHIAYWQNEMRKALMPKCPNGVNADQYVAFAGAIRDSVMAVKSDEDIWNYLRDHIENAGFIEVIPGSRICNVTGIAKGILDSKFLKASQKCDISAFKRKAQDTLFGIPENRKVYTMAKNRMNVYCYDNRRARFTSYGSDDRTQLAVDCGCTTYFYYPKENYANKDNWQLGKYFIVGSGSIGVIANNIDTQEKANQMVEAIAERSQEKADQMKLSTGKTTSKTAANRKTSFSLPHLSQIEQTGKNVPVLHVSTDRFMDELKFRGGEFGNWVSDNERQKNVDMAYASFKNLSDVLGIEDPSLGGSLAIAFGARGRGGSGAASAHYEPLRQVINLTKLSGAGCLAHEWGHALDHHLAQSLGLKPETSMASDLWARAAADKIPDSFKEVMNAIHYTASKEFADTEKTNQIRTAAFMTDTLAPIVFPEDRDALMDQCEAIYNARFDIYRKYPSYASPIDIPEFQKLNELYLKATHNTVHLEGFYKQIYKIAQSESRLKQQKSKFVSDSEKFDSAHSKAGHGYWASDAELFARAFDCYIADKLKSAGIRDDYLSAKSDCFTMTRDNVTYHAYPVGAERENINSKMDVFIADMRERGILKSKTSEQELANTKSSLSDVKAIAEAKRRESEALGNTGRGNTDSRVQSRS